MSLLMQQHLRALVETGLQLYLQMWQEYEVQPGSPVSFAGKGNAYHCLLSARVAVHDAAACQRGQVLDALARLPVHHERTAMGLTG
jgi:hypothetical protein